MCVEKVKNVAADGACSHVWRNLCYINDCVIIVASLLPPFEKRIGK